MYIKICKNIKIIKKKKKKMVVRGEGDVGRIAPATAPAVFVPSCARSYPPRSLVPPRSFVPPALPSHQSMYPHCNVPLLLPRTALQCLLQ
jgi:hypothetical protein